MTQLESSQLEQLLETALEAAQAAGDLIHRSISGELDIHFKDLGAHNLVTALDLASEDLIKLMIRKRMPDAVFLAEESGGDHDLTELTWVVDPIDGTVNYAHGVPIYCVSIAAVKDNQPLVGVIYHPSNGELFTATQGGGAYLNGVRLSVSETNDLSNAILVSGFPYNVAENPYGCIDTFADFLRLGIPVRRLGSAALDLAYVAAGRFDAYWEVDLNEWDVAAGALMVQEAGGAITTYAPEPASGLLIISRLLASNGKITEQVRQVLERRNLASS